MKIAICISGKSNLYKNCYSTFFKNLVQNYNVDIFFHTWNNEYIEDIIKIYNPKKFIVENFSDDFIFSKLRNKKLIDNIVEKKHQYEIRCISQYYSINESNKLKILYENENNFKYDIVIRYRFDIHYGINIDIFNIDVPDFYLFHSSIISSINLNDQLFISNSYTMDLATNIFDYIDEYSNEIIPFAEATYYFHWKKQKIINNTIKLNYSLFKGNEYASQNGHVLNHPNYDY